MIKVQSIALFGMMATCVVAATGTAMGQTPASSSPSTQAAPTKHYSRWAAEKTVLSKLELTPVQKNQIKDAAKPLEEDAKALKQEKKAGDTVDETSAKQKRKADRKSYLEKLQTILTPAQWAKYVALHKELKEKAEAATSGTAKP